MNNLPTITEIEKYRKQYHDYPFYRIKFSDGNYYSGMDNMDVEPTIGMDIITFIKECQPMVWTGIRTKSIGMEQSGKLVFMNPDFWSALGLRLEIVKGRKDDDCPDAPQDAFLSFNYSDNQQFGFYPMRLNIYKD